MPKGIEQYSVAFVKVTNEPVFITEFEDHTDHSIAVVRRAVTTETEGMQYVEDRFDSRELMTAQEGIINTLDLTKFEVEMRDKYSERYQRAKQRSAAKPGIEISVPQADGISGLN